MTCSVSYVPVVVMYFMKHLNGKIVTKIITVLAVDIPYHNETQQNDTIIPK